MTVNAEGKNLSWDDWFAYLDRVHRDHPDTQQAVPLCRIFTRYLRAFHPTVALPQASLSEDMMLMIAWDQELYHLNIEFYPDGRAEWFYLDRRDVDTYEGKDLPQAIHLLLDERLRTHLNTLYPAPSNPSFIKLLSDLCDRVRANAPNLWIETATGEALDRLAHERYRQHRDPGESDQAFRERIRAVMLTVGKETP